MSLAPATPAEEYPAAAAACTTRPARGAPLKRYLYTSRRFFLEISMVAGWLFRVRSSRTRFPKLRGRRRGGAAAPAVSSGSQRRAHGRIVAAMHCLSRPAILRLSRAAAGMARSAAHSWALQRCCRSSQIFSAVRAGCSTLQGLQATMRAAAMLALPPPGPPNSTLTCSLQLENKRGRARGRRGVKTPPVRRPGRARCMGWGTGL